MSDQKQVGTYIRPDQYDLLQAAERSNAEIFREALDLYFEAHGKGSAVQIEENLAEVREERSELREEMLARIGELEEREAELEAALEKKRELQQSRESLQREILEDMEQNPAKKLLAYQKQMQKLLAHSDGASTREEMLANLRGLASEYDVNISRLEGYGAGPAVATDGDGTDEPDIDPSRYEFDEEGDS